MTNKTVLLVDDEEKNIKLLKGILGHSTYNLVGVLNGEEAIKTATDICPDLILLDIMMPGIDGFEVCRKLKHDERTSMIPTVMVTALSEKEHSVKAMEAGAEVLVLDMETNGGRVDATEEIMEILGRFPGTTVTYVNRKAFSAGAFISVATQKIFMAPQSVIGAAAPIMITPGGGGVQEMPDTLEVKTTSALSALVMCASLYHPGRRIARRHSTLSGSGPWSTTSSGASRALCGVPQLRFVRGAPWPRVCSG